MNVLIAKTIAECEQWADVAVVVDVLGTGSTLCSLLKRGKKDVLLFAEAKQAEAFAQTHGDFEVYCDEDLSVSHEGNSPYLASKASAHKPALVAGSSGAKAVMNLRNASTVLMGGFCNFYALAETLSNQGKDVLLIPSALYGMSDDVEDGLCVSALKDYIQRIGNPQDAIVEFNNTMRCDEFIKHGPKTADKDLKLSFKLDGLPIVPQISFSQEGYGVCHPAGTQAPAKWMGSWNQQPQQEAPATAAQADDLPAEPAPQQAAASQPAAAQTERTERLTPSQTKTKLKSFFNGILQAVKEEKEELQREIASVAPASEPSAAAPQSDDLLDAVLKKSEQAAPSHPKETPAVQTTASDAVVPSAEVTFSGKAAAFGDKKKKKAIVLFSGGLDSTTCLYWALAHGYECEALTVSYGQRHDREVLAAQMIARNLGVKHHMITLNLPWLSCCSLVDKNQVLPDIAVEDIPNEGIPSTYVPGRNLMFLSVAGSLLDAIGADAIIAGPNAVDFSGYPDCTPAFFKAAADALNRGTKMGVSEGIEVLAPLMRLSKAQIVKLAASLKVPFELTWSCYAGGKKPCGHCDSCKLRAKGFAEAGVHDTALD